MAMLQENESIRPVVAGRLSLAEAGREHARLLGARFGVETNRVMCQE